MKYGQFDERFRQDMRAQSRAAHLSVLYKHAAERVGEMVNSPLLTPQEVVRLHGSLLEIEAIKNRARGRAGCQPS